MKVITNLFFLLLLGAICQAQTTLGYSLLQDDVFVVRQEAQQIITQTMDGAAHEITNDIDGILEFKVLGETEGSYEIAMRFKDLNLKMTSSIQGELMNVRAKEVIDEDIQSKIFNSLLDVPIRMVLTKTGDVLDISGVDSLIQKMSSASGLEDEFSLNLMKKGLEKEFGTEALSSSYKQMTFIYSENEVKVGDTWQNEYTGKLNAKNDWTLDELTEENAKISGSAEVIMNIEDSNTTMKLTGSQQTTVTTDLKSGFIELMTVEGSTEGTSTISQLGDQEIPTTIVSIITYQLINE